MHCLWGLQAQGFHFELKGGTSLSKGFGVIHGFSEDIDIRIEPPDDMDVKVRRIQDKPAHVASRRNYYDALTARIQIPGIEKVERDTQFEDEKLRSAGIDDDSPVQIFDAELTELQRHVLRLLGVPLLVYRPTARPGNSRQPDAYRHALRLPGFRRSRLPSFES